MSATAEQQCNMDIEYLDFYDPFSMDEQVLDPNSEDSKSDSRAKEHRNHRRTTEMIEIPDKALWRKAYGLEQFLEVLKFEKPKRGYSLHVMTGGNVDMICYLKYLLMHYEHMNRVVISTWCLGSAELLMMEQWFNEGRVDSYDMYTGEHCRQQCKIEWGKLERMKEAGMIGRLISSTIHCKLILCDTGDEKIVVETSSNFNMNPRLEQGCVTVNEDLFNFYDEYMRNLK